MEIIRNRIFCSSHPLLLGYYFSLLHYIFCSQYRSTGCLQFGNTTNDGETTYLSNTLLIIIFITSFFSISKGGVNACTFGVRRFCLRIREVISRALAEGRVADVLIACLPQLRRPQSPSQPPTPAAHHRVSMIYPWL